MHFTDVVRFTVCVFTELINSRPFGTILVLGLRRKASDSGLIKGERREHTERELRERREGNVDPVTVNPGNLDHRPIPCDVPGSGDAREGVDVFRSLSVSFPGAGKYEGHPDRVAHH